MFKGEYSHSIDSKGRLIMPSKFRELLGNTFTVTKGFDQCLMAFDQEGWEQFESKLRSQPINDPRVRKLQRYFIGGAKETEIDKQGRARIPGSLREHAKLGKEIVLVGVGSFIEIWDKEVWEQESTFDDISSIAEELQGLGIEF